MGNVEIKESLFDKKSLFNIKRARLGNIKIDRPMKTINIGRAGYTMINELKNTFENPILEYSRTVREKNVEIIRTGEEKRVYQFFHFKKWMRDYSFIFTHTFKFNPFNAFKKLEELEGYIRPYAEISAILLVPNIKISIYDEQTREMKRIINLDNYIEFVTKIYSILDYRNKKPIFAPLSLRFGYDEIERLANEYIKNEFNCVWIDFEGSAITELKVAKVKLFVSKFEKAGRLNDLVIFATNIKREIISNIKSDKSPASDVLAPLIGANIVGVNKEPLKIPGQQYVEHIEELRKHKARVFDASTYYYLKLDITNYTPEEKNKLMSPDYNILFNSKLLDNEFMTQAHRLLEEGTLKDYVGKKEMLNERRELMRYLFVHEKRLDEYI